MLNEISRRCINISKHEETILNYHNSAITLRGDKHLHILELSHNLQCLDKKINLVESSIPSPKNSACVEYLANCSKDGLKNIELVEMITNPYLWPYSDHLNRELTNIMSFKWSPSNVIFNNQSVLATLNSVGNLNFFGKQRKVWTDLFDFSSIIKQYLVSEALIPATVNKHMSFNKLKGIVYSISITTFCWCPLINKDKSCFLATAQKSGCIYFWCLLFHDSDLSVKNVGKIQTSDVDIMSMEWIPFGNDKFLFIYSNMLGEITANVCQIQEEKIQEISTMCIWKYKDRSIPKYITYILKDNKIILIFDKHRHFIAQMYDEKFNLISEVVKIINDEQITTITKANEGLFVATINTNIYTANIICNGDTLDLSFEQIHLKDSYLNHELYGLCFTENDAICNIALIDRSIKFRKEQLKLYVVSLHFEGEKEIDSLIFKNPSNELAPMWDCIELIRYKCMKTKKLPSIDYASFYKEADTDIYKMKVYLVLLQMYNSLEGILKNLSKGILPETSVAVVQDKILAAYASSRIYKIYEMLNNDCELSTLESESLFGCRNFLEHYSKKYKCSLTNCVPNVDFQQIDIHNEKSKLNTNKYICQFCDDVIEGFTCKSKHTNMFCVLTLTPIVEMEYLVCMRCNVTARIDLYQFEPKCVFCDAYMDCFHLIY
ncbi:uncharacterized protein LOC119835036 [Zerene cesonia]|uniref:uncharacterized protein LOC119835036 n=1 Tax=Zerene cesonia TaxID=33412 RepID=UPI0018E59684|nr:uncharacterized protein LOC119835036 [Zerene cesonia]